MISKHVKFLLLLCLFFCCATISYARDNVLVGHWSWLQHTTTMSNKMSLCTGDVDFRQNGTFHIWNACKENSNDCYTIGEADGTWEKIATGVYRCYYGCYFYDFLVKGDSAFFQSMSVCDEKDRGHMEYGSMLKTIKVDKLKPWYEDRKCNR